MGEGCLLAARPVLLVPAARSLGQLAVPSLRSALTPCHPPAWIPCRDDVRPCRVYLRHCVLAAQRLGPEAYASFLDSTCVVAWWRAAPACSLGRMLLGCHCCGANTPAAFCRLQLLACSV